ncbi:ABC transporter ATP-binding protein [Pullulanibacillus sp. KACC 23026]|uniref:ABC transporter ATP-binding protein n=1 Tax=Pullulanibacillus sp. KACC 23026 TaxID=3028315 RepID=UPI0023AF0E09|nr:ABC transporter ATP-binding protein [Pullulanibacillus sp. KACC 23026]WEG10836.1 ABC transporter ATP-binding protein [Pullulanibacillus sp. KACC 23026]
MTDPSFQAETISKRHVFRRLLSYTKAHKKILTITFIILLLATGADILGPILAKVFIDRYLTPRHFVIKPLVLLGVGYLMLYVVSVICHYYQRLSFQSIALRIIQTLRVDVFSKVQTLGLAFYDRTPGGSLVSRITNDTEAIKELFVSVLSTFVQSFVMLIGIFIGMFFLNVELAAFCLAILPIILVLMWAYRRYSAEVFRATRQKLSQLNAKLNESLQGMNIIQDMRQEKRLRREFAAINQSHYLATFKRIKLNSLMLRPAVYSVYLLTLMLVLSFFGIQSFSGAVEIGVLYAFVNYLDRFFDPINNLMVQLTNFQQAIVSAERVFGLLDETELAPSQKGAAHPAITSGEVEFKNVSFSYDGQTDVLKHISFVAKPGQTVALVGHTGSGKSSIINLLMRFYKVERGQIIIDGMPLDAYDNEELRQKLGLVLQDSFLFVGDLASNIRLAKPDMTDEEVQEAAAFVQADSFIQKLPEGYNSPIGERGATLSSGERQLISFARTMSLKPKILVLDEATANIDTETEDAIQTALKKMRHGRTTIAIAHRLSTIQDADLILVLHHGEIVERGTHQELLAQQGLYHKMYLLQQGESVGDEIPAS